MNRGVIIKMNNEYLRNLVIELAKYPQETEWIEFKKNKIDPNVIGEYISALSNSAAILSKEKAYIILGIDDETHAIEGTNFHYRTEKKGGEELEAWLSRLLEPRIDIKFKEIEIEGKHITVLVIPKAQIQPIKFQGEEFIRVGSNKKKLKEFPSKERSLWRSFDTTLEELKVSENSKKAKEVLQLLNYEAYYSKLNIAVPSNYRKIIGDFIDEKFIVKNDAGLYDITNMGALILAHDITKFSGLSHKYVRVIWYKDNTKLQTIRETKYLEGYAVSFEKIIEYVMTIIPQKEVIENGIRRSEISYPEIAIRELLANCLIHQNIAQSGTSPMIEIFNNRIEISNAGAPLVAIERIVDTVAVSRNENLAGFMHKCGICEERGSGYDKVVYETSKNNLIAPKVENQNDMFTKVTLYSKVPFDMISKEDRIRTCYMHACYLYVQGECINNNVLRDLFGVPDKQRYKISRIIKNALDSGCIKAVDDETAPRYMKYIPFWG